VTHWRKRSEDGTAAVEFALILPIIAILCCGAIDYGEAANLTTQLNSAARAGAQYALSHPDDPGGIAWAAQNSIRTSAALVTIAVPGNSALSGTNPYYCTCSDSNIDVANQVSCTAAVSGVAPCTGTKKFFVKVTATQTFTPFLPYPGIASGVAMTGVATVQVR
jgi:Flp pilus assembly protein TadG